MRKYCLFIFIFLCIICVSGCKPSPRMGGRRQEKTADLSENTLSPQIIEKIQNRYKEETGYTIKVVKVHEINNWGGSKYFVEIIIERDGKRYLTSVQIEEIDGVPVIDILYGLDKEIK